MYTYIYIHTSLSLSLLIYVCIYIYIYICLRTWYRGAEGAGGRANAAGAQYMFVCIYIYIYIYLYICIHVYATNHVQHIHIQGRAAANEMLAIGYGMIVACLSCSFVVVFLVCLCMRSFCSLYVLSIGYSMEWYGMVRCGVAWCGVVRHGVASVARCDAVRYDIWYRIHCVLHQNHIAYSYQPYECIVMRCDTITSNTARCNIA